MACGCQAACGCDVQAGAGIVVQRLGDRFVITNAYSAPAAADVTYDNAASGLVGDDVQEALDELAARPIAPAAALQVVRGHWDFAVDGGAVGTIPVRDDNDDPLVIEEGAIVYDVILRFIDPILPDSGDPSPGGAEVKFAGGTAQLEFFQDPGFYGDEFVQASPGGYARSFTPGGTAVNLEVFAELTGGAVEFTFILIPPP